MNTALAVKKRVKTEFVQNTNEAAIFRFHTDSRNQKIAVLFVLHEHFLP